MALTLLVLHKIHQKYLFGLSGHQNDQHVYLFPILEQCQVVDLADTDTAGFIFPLGKQSRQYNIEKFFWRFIACQNFQIENSRYNKFTYNTQFVPQNVIMHFVNPSLLLCCCAIQKKFWDQCYDPVISTFHMLSFSHFVVVHILSPS